MSGGADDLTGRWLGIFNYPDESGAVGFTADLIDTGGRLGGTITEQDAVSDGRTLEAGIDGRREDTSVEFTKFYEDADPESYDTVAYRGTVNGEGTEISGSWEIPGVWSGSFIMTRPAAEAVDVSEAVGEEVRLS